MKILNNLNKSNVLNGVNFTILPNERFKSNKVSVHFKVPNDRKMATALAILPHVLDRNCAYIPNSIDLARKLAELYGASIASNSTVFGTMRVVSLSISGICSDYLPDEQNIEEEYLNLLFQLIFHPKVQDNAFSAEDVAIEKDKQADVLRSEINDKRSYCLRQAQRKLYQDSALSVAQDGYLEDMEWLTPEKLYDAYTYLLQSAQIEVIVGGVDDEKVFSMLKKELQHIDRDPVRTLNPYELAKAPASYETYTETMDTIQDKMALFFTSDVSNEGNRKGFVEERVALAVFGMLPTSRLFQNVREKQSLCYYCAPSLGYFSNVLCIDSGIQHADLDKATKAILKELDIIQKTAPSQEEVKIASDALCNFYSMLNDNLDSLELWYLNENIRNTNLSLDEAIQITQQVVPQKVSDILSQFKPALQYVIAGKEEV